MVFREDSKTVPTNFVNFVYNCLFLLKLESVCILETSGQVLLSTCSEPVLIGDLV